MINYSHLAESCKYYSGLGYKRIETPWWVSQDILDITKPPEAEGRATYFLPANKKCLVASGEQSFLYLANKGSLAPGRYFTITPCFRDEVITTTHSKYFIKNELINTEEVNEKTLNAMIVDAYGLFQFLVPNECRLKIVETSLGFDILYDGIELGSYGIRSCGFLDWIYGTGCAEPRLSRAIALSERNRK